MLLSQRLVCYDQRLLCRSCRHVNAAFQQHMCGFSLHGVHVLIAQVTRNVLHMLWHAVINYKLSTDDQTSGACVGGGKSTLMTSLYRIVEPCDGSITIDGIDVSQLGLADLRSRLALVPQDPVIFSGTVRANLDPFDAVGGDAFIWQALQQAGMADTIRQMPGGLDAEISEGGGNLSTGQRQLLCMARALLRRTKILVLDEATSNVDNGTDQLIQATIRSAFKHCTVLTIAHRLHTIIDSDRIMVLDAGRLVEFDAPQTLLKNPESVFSKLVAEASRQTNEKVSS